MEQKQRNPSQDKYYQCLGKWYSWDSPIGLSLGFGITLFSLGAFIFFLHQSGFF